MGHKSLRGELGLPSLQELWQNCFGIPAKGAECKLEQRARGGAYHTLETAQAPDGAPCHASRYHSYKESELEGAFWGHLHYLEPKGRGENSIAEKRLRLKAV